MMVRNLLSGVTLAAAATLLTRGGAYAQSPVSLPNPGVATPPTATASSLLTGYSFVDAYANTFDVTSGTQEIAGTFLSAVFKNNTNNTYAFLYQVVRGGGNAAITAFSVANWDPGATSVAQTGQGINNPGTFPDFSTGSVSGLSDQRLLGGIQFSLSGGLTTSGQTSYSQFVVTDATDYSTSGSASVFGPGGVAANVVGPVVAPHTVPPVEAPEPGSLALVATGLLGSLGMVMVRRRRSAA